MSNYIDSRTVEDPRDFQEDDERTDQERDADSLDETAPVCDDVITNTDTIAIQGDKKMKYFARQFHVYDYPYSGELCWCVVDSKGGFYVVANEKTAIRQAQERNAQIASLTGAEK